MRTYDQWKTDSNDYNALPFEEEEYEHEYVSGYQCQDCLNVQEELDDCTRCNGTNLKEVKFLKYKK